MRKLLLLCLVSCFISCTQQNKSFTLSHQDSLLFALADENATLANQGFIKCENYLNGWLQYRDSASGLIQVVVGR